MTNKFHNEDESIKSCHSGEYFGDYRDYWWNKDFLELMAKRWQLSNSSSLLDVGCGVGHWSRILFPYLASSEAHVTGIDREPLWVERARENFTKTFPDVSQENYCFVEGDALNLPFKDNSFDVVTCQTLLIHLSDPVAAVQEMLRVVKVGGLLISVEPENIVNMLNLNSLSYSYSVEILLKVFEFCICYEKGKMLLGQGNNSIGGQVPGFFANVGLKEINVYLSDKATPLFPPYNTEEQRIALEQSKTWQSEGSGLWNYEEVKSFFLASGESEESLEQCWEVMKILHKDYQEAVVNSSLLAGGGGLFYLVSGRKL